MKLLLVLALVGYAVASKEMWDKHPSAQLQLTCLNLNKVCEKHAHKNIMKLPHIEDFRVQNGHLEVACKCEGYGNNAEIKYVKLADKSVLENGHMRFPHGCLDDEERKKVCFNAEAYLAKMAHVFKVLKDNKCGHQQFYKLKHMSKMYFYQHCVEPFSDVKRCFAGMMKAKMSCAMTTGEALHKQGDLIEHEKAAYSNCVKIMTGTETCVMKMLQVPLYKTIYEGVCNADVRSFFKKIMEKWSQISSRHKMSCTLYTLKHAIANGHAADFDVCKSNSEFYNSVVHHAHGTMKKGYEKAKEMMEKHKKEMQAAKEKVLEYAKKNEKTTAN